MVVKVVSMISEPGHPAGDASDPLKEETTMFKTISAALVAVSVLAAPVLAAAPGKATQNTAIKAPVTKSVQAPVIKADTAKSKFLNANAHMGRHHVRHHRHHKHMGALKTHAAPKLAVKHVTPAPKRG
ncbi:hypothetical protein SAMN05444050_0872 [Afipia sp. GAS231]|nr:hypothetical protein SAMN05444050_0872 [Afipia sp. GAS231]